MNMSLPMKEQWTIENLCQDKKKSQKPVQKAYIRFSFKKRDYFYEAIIVMFKNNINLKISFRPVY